jgi:Uma2 family endonuclease
LLVVEVRSPSTALIDLNRKKAVFEKFGVPSYWIVDPDIEHPELTVFELRDGRYATEVKTTQAVTLDRPFTVQCGSPRGYAGPSAAIEWRSR